MLQEFLIQAERLIADNHLKQRITEHAKEEIDNRYSIDQEALSYQNVLESIFRD